MGPSARVLVYEADSAPAVELDAQLRAHGFSPEHRDVRRDDGARGPVGGNIALVRVDAEQAVSQGSQLTSLLRRLVLENVATLVWGAGDGLRREGGPLVEWLTVDAGLDEVLAKLGTLAHYAPLIRGFQRELEHMQRLGHQLNQYFTEIDQEMRLAGRLQRDFLPRKLPALGPYRFEMLYRPASWVSGDMYDAMRIDEHHLGMFVADAMGHGVAAGLLTMFLRQALVTRETRSATHELVEPADAMRRLHECLVRQQLPNCHFVTAAYGLLDARTGRLRLARAGHPYPLCMAADGTIREVRVDGSLLGLADVPTEFDQVEIELAPGDKLMFYSDGLEDVLLVPKGANGGADAPVAADSDYTPELQHWCGLPAGEFVRAVNGHLDGREGSLHPADDVTMLMLERADR